MSPPLRTVKKAESLGERRIVTALCYDLVGSTELFHRLDIEEFDDLIAAFQQACQQAVASNSGELRLAGDGGVAIFADSIDTRDAASLAIRAGLEIIEECRRIGRGANRSDLQVRVGIATSLAVIQDHGAELRKVDSVNGAALAMAARLAALASPETILISEETHFLVGRSYISYFQGEYKFKGFDTAQKYWKVTNKKKQSERFYSFGKLNEPIVGREEELHQLFLAWNQASKGAGQVILIEGEPGIGKSRLLHEARRMARNEHCRKISFQCLPGGSRSSLHPLLHAISTGFSPNFAISHADVGAAFARSGISDGEATNCFAYLLGATAPSPKPDKEDPRTVHQRALRATRKSLQAMCAGGPVLMCVEDIHWIDPTSGQLLAEVARAARHMPLLLLLTTRPQPPADVAKLKYTMHLRLRPLGQDETRRVIVAKWPEHRRHALPQLIELAERLSGGVPFFIEEVCQWISDGAEAEIVRKTESATITISKIESILEGRLARLGRAKDVALAAAVAGPYFDEELLLKVLPSHQATSVNAGLAALYEAGFLIRARGREGSYAFRHALIQETIYGSMLRKSRQMLHARLVGVLQHNRALAPWIDAGSLATHAERAGLLEDAIKQWIAAGQEHSTRSAVVEARHCLENALRLCNQIGKIDVVDPLRLSAIACLGPLLTGTIGLSSPPARKLYEDGVEIVSRLQPEERQKWFPIYWGWWLTGSDLRVMHDRALRVRSMLTEARDPDVSLQVNHCVWAIAFNRGEHTETQDAIVAGLSLYNPDSAKANRLLYGGHDAKVCALGQKSLTLWLTGQTDRSDAALAEMIAYVDSIDHLPSKAHSLDTQVVSAFYREDFEGIKAICLRMRAFAKSEALDTLSGLADLFQGWASAFSEDFQAGHAMFCSGLSALQRLNAVVDLPIYLDMYAAILSHQGNFDIALNVIDAAIAKAQETGHMYWLAELHRRRALVRSASMPDFGPASSDIRHAIDIARRQGAFALLARAQKSAAELHILAKE